MTGCTPLSSKADYYFDLGGGRTSDTSPASFEEMIQHAGADDAWGAHKNWRQAAPGDRVWAYYGTADGDLGVVGLATIRSIDEPDQPKGRATVNLTWNLAATKRLLTSPFPAAEVRKTIARPQGAMWRIEPLLAGHLRQHASVRSTPTKPPVPIPNYANGVTSTINYTPPTSVRVVRRHDALLRPLKVRLESAGWTPVPFDVGSKRVDLAMERRAQVVLVEAKTVSSSTNIEVRSAFAQLSEYVWRYRRRRVASAADHVHPWALFEKRPEPEEIEFLEDHGLMVSWADRGSRRLAHGRQTAIKAAKFGA